MPVGVALVVHWHTETIREQLWCPPESARAVLPPRMSGQPQSPEIA